MGQEPKRAYLEAIRKRYRAAKRFIKGKILDEFCSVCGFNRKYAIGLLHTRRKPSKKKPGPRIFYTADVLTPLKAIWLAGDQMCSKKLKAILPLWLPFYEQEQGILELFTRKKLLAISSATIDRMLKPMRASQPRKGLSGTKPGSLLKKQIPISTDHWDVSKPGFLEADTVAHCGDSLAGDFVWSITFTDILTAWTENRAVWNKGSEGVLRQVREVENGLPFSILGFDCDNGSEFLNHHLVRYFTQRSPVVQFSRSRPYHKNDNAHVEQKNWTHVRQLLGYDRFDNPAIIPLLNKLYTHEWSLYQNHFCPTMKLISKQRVGSKYQKRYDAPKTPYQRILDCQYILPETKEKLKAIHASLSPFKLKRDIESGLKLIFSLVKLSKNVRKRL
jgi:hypothetical protein